MSLMSKPEELLKKTKEELIALIKETEDKFNALEKENAETIKKYLNAAGAYIKSLGEMHNQEVNKMISSNEILKKEADEAQQQRLAPPVPPKQDNTNE